MPRISKFKEVPLKHPYLGLYKDVGRQDVPIGGWVQHNNFHQINQTLLKYAGWAKFDEEFSFTDPVIYGYDFVKLSRERFFVFATKGEIYLYNRTVNGDTSDPAGSVTELQNGFSGGNEERWQSAVMNDALILTKLSAAPQLFLDDDTPIADLTGDAALPEAAKFVINSNNHLVFANTVEGGNAFPFRIRWSDIDDYSTYVRTSTNEAGHLDVEGEITGIESIGPSVFLVYTTEAIYEFAYVGLPLVYTKNRIVKGTGSLAPYGLVVVNDEHFFFGTEGFYRFSGRSAPQRIGKDRVDRFMFSNFVRNEPERVYGFAHPEFPEIWWVYQSDGSDEFDSVLIYNRIENSWCERTPFPHSMMASFLLDDGVTWEELTNTWDEFTQTWRELGGEGKLLVMSGLNTLYVHGAAPTGDGLPIIGVLETGDIFGRNLPVRLSRVLYDIQGQGASVTSEVGCKNKPSEAIMYQTPVPLDEDFRHDIRLVAKIFSARLTTEDIVTLSDLSAMVQDAGMRV